MPPLIFEKKTKKMLESYQITSNSLSNIISKINEYFVMQRHHSVI